MPRQRKLLGKRPGGNFGGIPGNLGPQRGWGDAFKKIGDWGVLNPNEWVGFGKRQGLVESVLRPQYSLQEVISTNLDIEAEQQRARAQRSKARTAPAPVQAPTMPGEAQKRTPSPAAGVGKAAPVGAKATPKAPAAPKATPAKAAPAKAAPAPLSKIKKAQLNRNR